MLRVAVIQPSSPPSEEALKEGLAILERLGFKFKSFADPTPSSPAFSAFLLTEVINTSSFDYLWAIRGGFGALRLLPYLEEALSLKKPSFIPPLIGFSDVTVLHCFFWQRFRKLGVHAPVVVSLREVEETALQVLQALLQQKSFDLTYEGKCFQQGKAKGILIGGNLTSLASLCGTPYFPQEKEIILFLEDVNEPCYRLERALTQLFYTFSPFTIKGMVLGDLGEVKAEDLLERIRDLLPENIPIGFDFPFGHVKNNYPLVFGAKAFLIGEGNRSHLKIKGEL